MARRKWHKESESSLSSEKRHSWIATIETTGLLELSQRTRPPGPACGEVLRAAARRAQNLYVGKDQYRCGAQSVANARVQLRTAEGLDALESSRALRVSAGIATFLSAG